MKTYSSSWQIVFSVIAVLVLCSGHSVTPPFCPRSFQEPGSEPYKQWIIEVLGSVPRPGVYFFRNAPTPAEAFKKAGGKEYFSAFIQDSESHALPSGTTIHVTPGLSQSFILHATDTEKTFIAGLPMDINKASAATLSLVPGISTTLAHRIVADRIEHGHFTSWNALSRVKGIGPATINRIRHFLRLPNLP